MNSTGKKRPRVFHLMSHISGDFLSGQSYEAEGTKTRQWPRWSAHPTPVNLGPDVAQACGKAKLCTCCAECCLVPAREPWARCSCWLSTATLCLPSGSSSLLLIAGPHPYCASDPCESCGSIEVPDPRSVMLWTTTHDVVRSLATVLRVLGGKITTKCRAQN